MFLVFQISILESEMNESLQAAGALSLTSDLSVEDAPHGSMSPCTSVNIFFDLHSSSISGGANNSDLTTFHLLKCYG